MSFKLQIQLLLLVESLSIRLLQLIAKAISIIAIDCGLAIIRFFLKLTL
jgi:hypothetical protein